MNKLNFRFKLMTDAFVFTKSRKSATRNIFSVIVCIALAVIVSLLVATTLGNNPFQIISDLFTKAFVEPKTLIWNITLFGIGGLAFSFAFKAGVFNIGIPGQMMMSGFMVLVIANAIEQTGVKLPNGLGPILMILVAIVFGALVASISSLLKVYLNVNEVVSAILLNWIILFLVRLVVFEHYNPGVGVFSQSIDIPEQFRLVDSNVGGWLPALIVFLILVASVFITIYWTTFGHKITSVGFSQSASTYAGYNVKFIQVSTMAISGGIAGILALVLYTSGQSPSIPLTYDQDALPQQGFSGIAIGLIALNNPIAIIPVSFIMGLFNSSSAFLQVPPSFSSLIVGLIILGATIFVVFSHFKPWLWLLEKIYSYKSIYSYKKYENDMEVLISKYKLQLSESNSVDKIDLLKKEYLVDKNSIKTEYLKNIILLQAEKKYKPEIKANHIITEKNNKIKHQFLKYENNKNKKIFKLSFKKNNYYKNIIYSHTKLLNRFNSLSDLQIIKFENFNSIEQKLLFITSQYYLLSIKKHYLFNSAIEKTIDKYSNFRELVNDLKKTREKINEKHANFLDEFLNLFNKKIANNVEFDRFVFRNINFLSSIQIYRLRKTYFKYLKNSESSISLTKKDLEQQLNQYIEKNKWIEKLPWLSVLQPFELKVNLILGKYESVTNSIDIKTSKYLQEIEKSRLQADKWCADIEKNYYRLAKLRDYALRNLRHNDQKELDKLINKVKKLNLSEEEKVNLEKNINDLHNQYMNTLGKE